MEEITMNYDEEWQWTTEGLVGHAEYAFPERIALLATGRPPLSYARLGAFCRSMREGMRVHGFVPGARIAVALSGGAEMAAAFLAVTSFGVCVPLSPTCREAEAARFLTRARADGLMIDRGTAAGLRAAASDLRLPVMEVTLDASTPAGVFACDMPVVGPPLSLRPPDREAIALLLSTSGTTGASNLVYLTHGNICSSARQIVLTLRLQPDDRSLNIMPLTHIAALGNVVLASVAAGASVICTDDFQPAEFFDLMEKFAPTWYTASPAMHRAVLDVAPRARGVISTHPLRFVRTSAAPCPVTVADELEQCFGVPVVNHYGLTETGPLVAANPLPPGRQKRGSVGLPAGCEVAIMDAGGTLLERCNVGEVVVRGPNVMRQHEGPDDTGSSSAFVDGWFCTGDLGYVDADGYVFLTGRLKELINRGGEKIAPAEVEDALLTHPSVRQAAAFGIPDSILGEEVAAAVVLADGSHTTAAELRSFAAQLLSAPKVPRRILVLKELPTTPFGKVLRRRLAEMAANLEVSAGAGVDAVELQDDLRNHLQELLLGICRNVLGVAKVGLDDDFLEMGGDSLGATRLIARVHNTLGCSLGYAEVFDHGTVRRLAELLMERVTVPPEAPATP
jgi:acyl-CoA synthetase (AMP-forming)/AMP-acid ligase II/acyl carrier protein